MRTMFTRFVPLTVAALCLSVATAPAATFAPRSPQVVFNTGPLQGYLNLVDPGINVATQQLDAQLWASSVTGDADLTLMIRNGLGNGTSLGVYNGNDPVPALFLVFPGAAGPGWFATLHFGSGNLFVSLFDQNSVFLGQTIYAGVNQNNFGWYIQGPAGLWFSEDKRNGPGPQMLTFDSPAFSGDYWLCFEPALSNAASTFDGVVLSVQSLRPSPASRASWGGVKALYH